MAELYWRRALFPAAMLAVPMLSGPASARDSVVESFGGRDLIVHVPDAMPPAGTRALVTVLHGRLGNAERIANRQSQSRHDGA